MNNENNHEGCRCGAPVRIIDMYGSSATVFCDRCKRYSLALQTDAGRQVIHFTKFSHRAPHSVRHFTSFQRPTLHPTKEIPRDRQRRGVGEMQFTAH